MQPHSMSDGGRRWPIALLVALALSGAPPGLGACSAFAQSSMTATLKELGEALSATNANTPPADPAYTIVCRGLRKTTFYYSYDVPPNYNQILPQGYLLIEFEKGRGNVGIGGSQLKPGECAWRDRRFNADEPARILVPYVAFRAETDPGHPGTVARLEVLFHGMWRSTAALAREDFVVSLPVYRVGQNFVVPDPVTKMGAPSKAK